MSKISFVPAELATLGIVDKSKVIVISKVTLTLQDRTSFHPGID